MPHPLPVLEAVSRLPHKAYHHAQTTVFAGKREMGKTTAFSEFIEVREPRLLQIDFFDEQKRVRFRYDADDALDELEEGGPCRRRIKPPRGVAPHEWLESVLTRRVINGRVRNFLLGIDEVNLACRPANRGVVAGPALTQLVLQGRKYGCRTAAATQRLGLVPDVLLSECTELLLFRMFRPRDLEVVAEWTSNETKETVSKLRVGECIALLDL